MRRMLSESHLHGGGKCETKKYVGSRQADILTILQIVSAPASATERPLEWVFGHSVPRGHTPNTCRLTHSFGWRPIAIDPPCPLVVVAIGQLHLCSTLDIP